MDQRPKRIAAFLAGLAVIILFLKYLSGPDHRSRCEWRVAALMERAPQPGVQGAAALKPSLYPYCLTGGGPAACAKQAFDVLTDACVKGTW